jgi:hypothetical protein
VYRIGQEKPVVIKKLVLQGTLEERIVEIANSRLSRSSSSSSTSSSSSSSSNSKEALGVEEIRKLFEKRSASSTSSSAVTFNTAATAAAAAAPRIGIAHFAIAPTRRALVPTGTGSRAHIVDSDTDSDGELQAAITASMRDAV